MNHLIWIKDGRVIDPANNVDEKRDLFIKNGKITYNLNQEDKQHAEIYNAQGLIVAPGLVDIHVHFREPGQTHKENTHSGSQTAAAGGVTTIVTMPNTSPACDSPATIELIKSIAEKESLVNIYTTGCLTLNRQGQALAPIGSLKQAGVVALTDDGDCIQNNEIMRRACEYAKMHNLPVMDHCQDMSLTQNSVMNEGIVSTKLGLQGWPNAAEDIIVSRNVILSQYTGAHIHMQHITSGNAVNIIRNAKAQGINVTAEVTPHHLALTEDYLQNYNPNYKMNPPLRTETDRQALIQGLLDGTIDIIATDHAPHANYEKDTTLNNAPFGILGLQTLLPISLQTLYHSKKMTLPDLLALLSHKPANLLNLPKGTLTEGADADLVLFNPDQPWTFNQSNNYSKSSNSPWLGKKLIGKVKATFTSGTLVYTEDSHVLAN